MNNAIGIVAAIVNTPQGLCASALTTTKANTAKIMIITPSAPSMTTIPANDPNSCLAISPSDRPSRRVEINKTKKS